MFTALLSVFALVVTVNIFYYLLFSKFSFATSDSPAVNKEIPVSVIVCAKNESENLKKNIPEWLAQSYPDFELILVNDASTDDTLEVMESFQENHEKIKTVNVRNNEAFWANKKYALTLGIKRAKNHHFLFTDADCRPRSSEWIAEMASRFTTEKQIVLGYGAYKKEPGFLNKLIRFETFLTAVQYFSYAKLGIPYMGVGRNLAYTSYIFYENNGFMKHMHVRSGDDDLFVNEVADKSNTAVCYSKESFTESVPEKTFGDWVQQKKRHITTASHYKASHKFLLGLYFISSFLFWFTLVISFFFIPWPLVVCLAGLRLLVQYICLRKAFKKLEETGLFLLTPVLELFLICFQLTIFISNLFSKPKHWK